MYVLAQINKCVRLRGVKRTWGWFTFAEGECKSLNCTVLNSDCLMPWFICNYRSKSETAGFIQISLCKASVAQCILICIHFRIVYLNPGTSFTPSEIWFPPSGVNGFIMLNTQRTYILVMFLSALFLLSVDTRSHTLGTYDRRYHFYARFQVFL